MTRMKKGDNWNVLYDINETGKKVHQSDPIDENTIMWTFAMFFLGVAQGAKEDVAH